MKDQVVSVIPSRTLCLHTTQSLDFLGFHQKVNWNFTTKNDVIIGVIDTRIWLELESFNDKIIGARFYPKSSWSLSAKDNIGHGTHNASTVASNQVLGSSFYGLAQGTTRGGVPPARIVVYKICHPNVGYNNTDILSVFDDAIADGVNIISISIGPDFASAFKDDSNAFC